MFRKMKILILINGKLRIVKLFFKDGDYKIFSVTENDIVTVEFNGNYTGII